MTTQSLTWSAGSASYDTGERMRNPEVHHQAVQTAAAELLARHVVSAGRHRGMADLPQSIRTT